MQSRAGLLLTFLVADAALAQVAVGAYVGDGGASLAVTGLGFAPIFVMAQGATSPFARSASMPPGLSKNVAEALALSGQAVVSLDPDGYTVGTDVSVNSAGVQHDWVALGSATGDFWVGSYVGTGAAQDVSGLPFQPDFVLFVGDVVEDGAVRLSSDPVPTVIDVSGTHVATAPVALLPDGFQVSGSSDYLNTPGSTYHYLAVRAVAGRNAVGSYAGDSRDGRAVLQVGFQPVLVWVKRVAGNASAWRTAAMGAGDTTRTFGSGTLLTNNIQALLPDGFELGTDVRVNGLGDDYLWLALGSADGGAQVDGGGPVGPFRLGCGCAASPGPLGLLLAAAIFGRPRRRRR